GQMPLSYPGSICIKPGFRSSGARSLGYVSSVGAQYGSCGLNPLETEAATLGRPLVDQSQKPMLPVQLAPAQPFDCGLAALRAHRSILSNCGRACSARP